MVWVPHAGFTLTVWWTRFYEYCDAFRWMAVFMVDPDPVNIGDPCRWKLIELMGFYLHARS
jgi:uncharacterized protein YaeQ